MLHLLPMLFQKCPTGSLAKAQNAIFTCYAFVASPDPYFHIITSCYILIFLYSPMLILKSANSTCLHCHVLHLIVIYPHFFTNPSSYPHNSPTPHITKSPLSAAPCHISISPPQVSFPKYATHLLFFWPFLLRNCSFLHQRQTVVP